MHVTFLRHDLSLRSRLATLCWIVLRERRTRKWRFCALPVRVKDVCAWSGTGGAGGCPEPSPVANAFWTLTETANGTSVVYTCVDGYQLTAGSLTRVCNVSYAVFDEKPPICSRESMCVHIRLLWREGVMTGCTLCVCHTESLYNHFNNKLAYLVIIIIAFISLARYFTKKG